MAIFSDWCDIAQDGSERKRLLSLTEKDTGRADIQDQLCETVRTHYDDAQNIADDVDELGYPGASAVLRELLPRTSRARSGELGEILATEFVEEELGFTIPVRRLRYKDGREMALRGDDFLGLSITEEDRLRLMKGEAKSRRTLGRTTIREAREALSRDNGRPTPSSLLFVANRLLDGTGATRRLGRRLRNEIARRAVAARDIEHVLFTVSGNGAPAALGEDLNATDNLRRHTVVNIHIEDHQDFIAEIYEEAGALGDD